MMHSIFSIVGRSEKGKNKIKINSIPGCTSWSWKIHEENNKSFEREAALTMLKFYFPCIVVTKYLQKDSTVIPIIWTV